MALPEDLVYPERIAQHAEWIRQLARTLVRDPSLAEDLSQDTLVIALATPEPRGRLKSWLATILRNRAHRMGRRESLRLDAEKRIAEAHGSAAAMDELSRHHELMGHLLELPEAYRETIVLRFYQQASHEEIAQQLKIAEATVRTRLTRGLSRLREKIEASHGSYGAIVWLWAAAGETGSPPTEFARLRPADPSEATSDPRGRVAIGPRAAAVGTLGLALVALWMGVDKLAEQGTTDLGAGEPAPSRVATLRALEGSEPSSEPRRSNSEATAPATLQDLSGTPRLAHVPPLRGQIVDMQGYPLANIRLVHTLEGEVQGELHSDGEGFFEFTPSEYLGQIEEGEEDLVGVVDALLLRSNPGYELTVVASPQRTLKGRVVDQDGNPHPCATVTFDLARDFRPELGRILHFTSMRRWRALTDDQGRFSIEDAPSFAGELEASLLGTSSSTAIEEWDDLEHEFVLESPLLDSSLVRGCVVEASGEAFPKAWVFAGAEAVETDPLGRFHFGAGAASADTLRVVGQGYLPVHVPMDRSSKDLEVVLREPALALSGRVVDEAGQALAGITVRVLEEDHVMILESYKGGTFRSQRSLETLISGSIRVEDVTDEQGRFEIHGLRDRAYQLCMSDPALRIVMSSALRPSEASAPSHELVFRGSTPTKPYSLRMVDPEGQPVAGLELQVSRQTEWGEDYRTAVWTPEFVTDAQGLVHLPQIVTRDGLGLATGTDPRFLRELWTLPPESAPDGKIHEIVLRPLSYLQVDLDPGSWPDTYRLVAFDDQDEAVPLVTSIGYAQSISRAGEVLAGLSEVYGIPYDARRMILSAGNGVVLERKLDLLPGELLRIRE